MPTSGSRLLLQSLTHASHDDPDHHTNEGDYEDADENVNESPDHREQMRKGAPASRQERLIRLTKFTSSLQVWAQASSRQEPCKWFPLSSPWW